MAFLLSKSTLLNESPSILSKWDIDSSRPLRLHCTGMLNNFPIVKKVKLRLYVWCNNKCDSRSITSQRNLNLQIEKILFHFIIYNSKIWNSTVGSGIVDQLLSQEQYESVFLPVAGISYRIFGSHFIEYIPPNLPKTFSTAPEQPPHVISTLSDK